MLANKDSQASLSFNAGDIIATETGIGLEPDPEAPSPAVPVRPFPSPDYLGWDGFIDLNFFVAGAMYDSMYLENRYNPCQGPCDLDWNDIALFLRRDIGPDDDFLLKVSQAFQKRWPTPHKDPVHPHHVWAALLAKRFFKDARQLEDCWNNKICGFGVLTGMINHDCQPNAEVYLVRVEERPDLPFQKVAQYSMRACRYRIHIQATRPIDIDEEITVAYDENLERGGRENQLQYLMQNYGFRCRCDSCTAEENDQGRRMLKDDVLCLLSEIGEHHNMLGPLVYRKAAAVLDGFSELGLNHRPLLRVWQICMERAQSASDMIRAYWFCSKFIERAGRMYGLPFVLKRPSIAEVYQILKDISNGKGLEDGAIEGYSVKPKDGYHDWEKGPKGEDLVEDLMFQIKKHDKYYHCLEVVQGKLQYIDDNRNDARLRKIMDERDANAQAERDAAEAEVEAEEAPEVIKKQLHEKTVAELMEEEFKEKAEPEKKPKKKSRKGKNKTPATASHEVPVPAAASIRFISPFVSPSGAPDSATKSEWLDNFATMEAVPVNKARNVGYLLAAKDGYAVKNEGYVLSARRDSCCGRLEGWRGLVELAGVGARRARTHSIGNDGGKRDLWKWAEASET